MINRNLETPSVLAQDKALDILKPHFPSIYASIEDGWEAWLRFGDREPELRRPLNATARANFVYCHIKEAAKRRFKDVPHVMITEKRGFLTLIFKEQVVLRFKKLNKSLRSSGIQTTQYLTYLSQQIIPGFEQTRIISGYTLDDLQMMIKGIHVVCPNGSRNQWQYEIELEPSTDVVGIMPQTGVGKPIVRPIAAKKQKGKSG